VQTAPKYKIRCTTESSRGTSFWASKNRQGSRQTVRTVAPNLLKWFVFPTRVFPTRAVCGSGASVEVAPELEVEVRDPYSARADLDPTRGTTTQAKPRTSSADLSQHEQQPSSGPASQVSQPTTQQPTSPTSRPSEPAK